MQWSAGHASLSIGCDNRVADHRSGYKANNLNQVLDGDLDPVIQSLVDAGNEAALKGDDGP